MNTYYLGQTLGLAAIYMLGSSGALFAIKNGDLNLGGEGQVYLGGFLAAILLNQFQTLPAFAALPLVFIIIFISGALLGLLSSAMKILKGASPLFTSFIISCAIIPLIDGGIAGRFRTKQGNLLATQFVPEKFRFPSIWEPSTLNGFIFIALILCIASYFFFYKTSFGRKLCIKGVSESFSEFSGYNNSLMTCFSLGVSGGLLALTGAVTVCGTYYTCHSGFYAGIGWNSLSAALLCGGNPILLIPSSLFMSVITTYSNKYALLSNLGFDLSSLLQGIILFLISFPIIKGAKK